MDGNLGTQQTRYKIILVGDVSVGKTALFWQYTQGQFLANKDTLVTAVDFKMKNITVKNKPIKMYIWDTAGSEKYRSIVSTYFKGCQGVIIVFDLSRQATFKNAIESWIPLAKSKCAGANFVLVGNKSDLDIRVSKQQVETWCSKNNFHYIETSVKLNQNVNQTFQWLAGKILQKDSSVQKTQSFSIQNRLDNKLGKSNQKKCCKS